jgi:hypothetical protein
MISVIFSFLPIILIFFSIRQLYKREYVNYDIKKGYICYNCKSEIPHTSDEKFSKVLDETDFSQLCIPCNRDIKIESLNSNYKLLFHKFKKWLVSKKSEKLFFYFLIPIVVLILSDIILKVLGYDIKLNYIYITLNIIYLIITIFKNNLTSKNKTSH